MEILYIFYYSLFNLTYKNYNKFKFISKYFCKKNKNKFKFNNIDKYNIYGNNIYIIKNYYNKNMID